MREQEYFLQNKIQLHSSIMSHLKLSFLLLLTYMVGRSVQVCAPDCTGVDPGTFVKDPTDCTRYYVCLMINGIMVPSDPVDCPSGEWFNVGHTVPQCDSIDAAPADFCDGLCNPCVIDCRLDNPGTLQPDPLLCSLYYICLDEGHSLPEECPVENAYFDFQTGNCQTDDTLCYDYCDPCLPHCTTDGERVHDPYDCHSFYACSPPDMVKTTCPSNGVFDRVSTNCGDYTCITDCTAK